MTTSSDRTLRITRQVFRLQNALGAQISLLPVSLGQAVELHRAASGRRMNEATFTDVDTGMTDLGSAIGGEEDQVTGLQAFLADVGRLHADHFAGGTRQDRKSTRLNSSHSQ